MKRILVLVGPKGAGKTTIGQLLEAQLGVPFIKVEPVYLQVRAALGPEHPDLERQGFQAILDRLTAALMSDDTICFESTGASKYTSWLLTELGRQAKILPVQVLADPAKCLDRIHHRDAKVHIPISDDGIEQINAVAGQVNMHWSATIDNRNDLDEDAILETISNLLRS